MIAALWSTATRLALLPLLAACDPNDEAADEQIGLNCRRRHPLR